MVQGISPQFKPQYRKSKKRWWWQEILCVTH
jgi:hypothetical protein